MKSIMLKIIPYILFLSHTAMILANNNPQVQKVYLSGTDKDHTVDWEFYCTGGRKSNYWTTIPVPSCWELQGFGTYAYGRKSLQTDEKGIYKHTFHVDADFKGKKVFIVFEGSMTDTEVNINGIKAGAIHQGAFYQFEYDITNLLKFGSQNLLEVTVSKKSTNESVNRAEREADYWIFGGIFRPVYLEVLPTEFIERTAINAGANGKFGIDVFLQNIEKADNIIAHIEDLDGNMIGEPFSAKVTKGKSKIRLTKNFTAPKRWTAETPNLYYVKAFLRNGNKTIHTITERFGFRTFEVRKGDGFYLNGQKIMLKGVNRHSFNSNSGRTLSDGVHLSDIKLMKQMNMNAVRMSHYPPDINFLHFCDSLGLYVINELAGWQSSYDDSVGEKLLREMIIRDVNHPSILLWSNGNEGGWNTNLDDDFSTWDPQERSVIHPWQEFSGIATQHYKTHEKYENILKSGVILCPTEFLHGLYDGGHGAGLNDYWRLFNSYPNAGGGFLWSFMDEGVVRSDLNDSIDVFGNNAPDGIIGPNREKEGSFYTIKEIWSPVYIEMDSLSVNFDGTIPIENRYSFININQCRFEWKLVYFPKPSANRIGYETLKTGTLMGPDIKPQSKGAVFLDLPSDWRKSEGLLLTAYDHNNSELFTWSWAIKNSKAIQSDITVCGNNKVVKTETIELIIVNTDEHEFRFSKATGLLTNVFHKGNEISFGQGPVVTTGNQTLVSISAKEVDNDMVIDAFYSGDMKKVSWNINSSGWINLQYTYSLNGSYDYYGVGFEYPEKFVKGFKWLGKGPYRVYKNRMKGGYFNVWSKIYNDAITGYSNREYPEFKGYHSNIYWANIETHQGNIIISNENQGLFLKMFSPDLPLESKKAVVQYPDKNIAFLDGIGAIGNKFQKTDVLGPESSTCKISGNFKRSIHLYFFTEHRKR